MIKVDLKQLELNEFYGKDDRSQHCRATFPLLGAHGSKDLATVYFELEPGDNVGRHTDSAEELILILEGDVELEIDGEVSGAVEGSVVLIPAMAPHNVTNSGSKPARILGFFGGANNIVTTFEQELDPIGTKIVDTSML